MAHSPEKNERNFLVQIDCSGGPEACQEWLGVKLQYGYGVSSRFGRAGGLVLAHRRVWEIVFGEIPPGMCVMQQCDNRACCNPMHLYLARRIDKNESRFFAKVDRSGGRHACHPWTGYIWENGYGCASLGRKTLSAHRRAWEIAKGPIPAGLHVLHHCDCKRCCNPEHLFLGTHKDNMEDKISKGREARGRNAGRAVCGLTDAQVQEIRRLAGEGTPQAFLADRFKRSQSTISRIIQRQIYAFVNEP